MSLRRTNEGVFSSHGLNIDDAPRPLASVLQGFEKSITLHLELVIRGFRHSRCGSSKSALEEL